jgi:hypothetical protein
MGDDGQAWETDDGTDLADVCKAQPEYTRTDSEFDKMRWEFSDGSAIVAAGGAWDIGQVGCYCWDGCAYEHDHQWHQPGCPMREEEGGTLAADIADAMLDVMTPEDRALFDPRDESNREFAHNVIGNSPDEYRDVDVSDVLWEVERRIQETTQGAS